MSGVPTPTIAALAVSGEGDYAAVGISEGFGHIEVFQHVGSRWMRGLSMMGTGAEFGALRL